MRRQVVRLRAASAAMDDPYRGLYVADEVVDDLLAASRPTAPGETVAGPEAELTREIRHRASTIAERAACDETLPLARLARAFGLDRDALDIFLLAVAPELDARYDLLYAYVQNDATQRRPTAGLALQLLSTSPEELHSRRRLLARDGPLLGGGLVSLVDDPQDRAPALPARWLKARERVVQFLLGHDAVDERLQPGGQITEPARSLDDLAVTGAARRDLEDAATALGPGWVLLIHGPDGVGKRTAAEAVAQRLRRPLLTVDLGVALEERPLHELLAAARLECALTGALLHLGGVEALVDDPAARARLARGLDAFPVPVVVTATREWPAGGRGFGARVLAIGLDLPGFAARERIWAHALAQDGLALGPDVDIAELAGKFLLSPRQIERAVATVADRAAAVQGEHPPVSAADLSAAARRQSSGGLRRLAQHITPVFTWSDIVLPPALLAQLHDVRATIRQRHVVLSRWGFGRKLSLGKGTHVLFSGPSGTGKTMAAEVLAGDIGLDLYKVELSAVVSKYIGETEKHLREIFGEARSSNAIVFLDECDALLGKRSKVKDAHDRYANIETAFLLQQLEEHEGTVILATNFAENVDDAFIRRMHHALEFPAPDAPSREEIWRRVIPDQAPLDADVDLELLAARFDVTGGHIRNIALAAAFLAADAGTPIGMEHLARATARELRKLGRIPSPADFGTLYDAAVSVPAGLEPG